VTYTLRYLEETSVVMFSQFSPSRSCFLTRRFNARVDEKGVRRLTSSISGLRSTATVTIAAGLPLFCPGCPEKERSKAEFSLAEELRSFLRAHAATLDPATTMALLSAHGRSEEALFYATLVQDYERVLAHHANNGPDYKAALDVLRKARGVGFERRV